jgi:phosphatidylinositol-3-phosphatase
MPPAVAAQIATFRDRDRGRKAAAAAVPAAGAAKEASGKSAKAGAAAAGAAAAVAGTAAAAGAKAASTGAKAADAEKNWWETIVADYFPSPRAAAALVLCMVGLGAIIGSATSQLAQSAGLQTIILDIAKPKPPPPEEEPVEEEVEAPEEAVAEAPALPVEEALPELPEEVIEEPLPELPEEAIDEPPPLELPEEFDPTEEEELPEIKHVFLVVLGENGYEESFGETSQAPYLSKTLPEQGEVMTNYYATSTGKLANWAALLSGQGPTQQLVAECVPTEQVPIATDIVPGTLSPEGQVEGDGCYYPATVKTLPGQFAEKKLQYRAYQQEAVLGVPEELSCIRPLGLFHQLWDKPECAESFAPISQLAQDLKDPEKAPAFSLILPNACHAGMVEPVEGCEPGAPAAPAGPAAAESFLREVVPQIVKSKAYEDNGLLLITSAEAPKVGPAPDTRACCATPAYPNLPPLPEEAPTGPTKATGGGGNVGLLLLSKFVKPGTKNESTYANHFTLLRTLEELFEFEPLGYAAEETLLPFDSTVFNYLEEEELTSGTEEEATTPEKEATTPKTGAKRSPVAKRPR